MKTGTLLYSMFFSGLLLAGASAQESRSDLLKIQEKLLKEEDSLKKQRAREGAGDTGGDKYLSDSLIESTRALVRLAKTPEAGIKMQKNLIAVLKKVEEQEVESYKNGLSSYSSVLERKMDLLKGRVELLVLEGEKASEADRKEIDAELEKDEKLINDFLKQGLVGGVVNIDQIYGAKVKFTELKVALARTREDRIKYQKELVDVLQKWQEVMQDRFKSGLAAYSVDMELAVVKAKLKLLDLEESI